MAARRVWKKVDWANQAIRRGPDGHGGYPARPAGALQQPSRRGRPSAADAVPVETAAAYAAEIRSVVAHVIQAQRFHGRSGKAAGPAGADRRPFRNARSPRRSHPAVVGSSSRANSENTRSAVSAPNRSSAKRRSSTRCRSRPCWMPCSTPSRKPCSTPSRKPCSTPWRINGSRQLITRSSNVIATSSNVSSGGGAAGGSSRPRSKRRHSTHSQSPRTPA